MNTDKCYKLTKYPKIFSNCYWGNHYPLEINHEEFNNRNIFAEEFKIKKVLHKKPFYEKIKHYYFNFGYFDHNEWYSTEDKDELIIITSPYCQLELARREEWEYMNSIGWESYRCLYGNCHTYILKLKKSDIRQLKFKKKHSQCICNTCERIKKKKQSKLSEEERIKSERDPYYFY